VYWQVLAECGALAVLAPELAVSQGITALTRTAPHTPRGDCRWAALLADLPETRATVLSERLKAPNAYTALAARVSNWRPKVKTALKDAETCMNLLKALDALRREEPFTGFCETLSALEQQSPEAQAAIERLRDARAAAAGIKAADFGDQALEGPALGAGIQAAQIDAIAKLLG